MTANVSIIVARREGALRLANAAFRFHPPENSFPKKVSASTSQPDTGSKIPKRKKDKRKAERIVYVLPHGRPVSDKPAVGASQQALLQPTQIKAGLTDGTATEVLEGLNEGDEVVTGMAPGKASMVDSFNPFASGRKRPGT
jgi:HlyD family secretion protein